MQFKTILRISFHLYDYMHYTLKAMQSCWMQLFCSEQKKRRFWSIFCTFFQNTFLELW